MLKYLVTILKWLSGKKSTIIAILAAVVTFLLSENIINENLAILLNGILIIVGGGASYATRKLVYKK